MYSYRYAHSQGAFSDSSLIRFVGARKRGEDDFEVGLLNANGQDIDSIKLPSRGHGAASYARKNLAVVFARRPGQYMCCIDTRFKDAPQFIAPVASRHFYGHGVFSADGKFLFTTENDIDTLAGVVGIYEVASGYKRIGEWNTHGHGPHDIKVIPELELLVVANGGIQTHPDTGRKKLNLSTMEPSISLLDTRSGHLVGQIVLPSHLHQLSLRHLAITNSGKVWFAGQYEGEDESVESIAGSFKVRDALDKVRNGVSQLTPSLLAMPPDLISDTKGYLTSIASNGNSVLMSSARGNIVLHVSDSTEQIVGKVVMFDSSGVTAVSRENVSSKSREEMLNSRNDASMLDDQFLLTSGTGELRFFPPSPEKPDFLQGAQWDNHIYEI